MISILIPLTYEGGGWILFKNDIININENVEQYKDYKQIKDIIYKWKCNMISHIMYKLKSKLIFFIINYVRIISF